MTSTQLKDRYEHCAADFARQTATLRQKNTLFVLSEVVSFALAAALLVCFFVFSDSWWWEGAVLMLALYFVVRHYDDKNSERIRHCQAMQTVYEQELKALGGDFTGFDDGRRYQDPRHPYAFDLDIFGPDSLYQRTCRTITTGGADALARMLSPTNFPSVEDIKHSRALQQELCGHQLSFFSLGRLAQRKGPHTQIDTLAVRQAIRQVQSMSVPAWYGGRLSSPLAFLLCIGLVGAVVLAALGYLSANIPLWWTVAQFLLVFAICKQTLSQIGSVGESLRAQLLAYTAILRYIASLPLESERGRQMQTTLADALPSFAQLEKILKAYDSRGNFLGLFFTDAFMMSDFFLVRRFLHWKQSYVEKMDQWMDIISEMDALMSMANFRESHPEAGDADILKEERGKRREEREMNIEEGGRRKEEREPKVGGRRECQMLKEERGEGREEREMTCGNKSARECGVYYEAQGLYHPFLGAKAVKNDFLISDTHYYIITGANMAGKSTFLRSIGINYVLAMAGMPVFADRLCVSHFALFSSMRTTDDLSHGISYFNAELLRLQQLIGFCRQQPHTLIILDEILKGTNSLDKLNGSRLFLEHIASLPVSGIIATHDLELSKMETLPDGRFHNYCFEIALGDDVTYTYKITPGVARNQNATFLLRRILDAGN